MKVSISWLNEYVPVQMTPSDLADALTMAGLEVEALWNRYDYLNTVVVGKIIRVIPHPNADKLRLCTVDIGERQIPVVCGAPNASEGMLSPVALPGTEFPNGVVLQKGVIRGQASEGMLCSEGELFIGEDRSGIMSLDPGLKIGEPLHKADAEPRRLFKHCRYCQRSRRNSENSVEIPGNCPAAFSGKYLRSQFCKD